MNAYDTAPKGGTYTHPLIRIETDQGVEGIGAGTYRMKLDDYVTELQPLIGKADIGPSAQGFVRLTQEALGPQQRRH